MDINVLKKKRLWLLIAFVGYVVFYHWPSPYDAIQLSPYQDLSEWPSFERSLDPEVEERITKIMADMSIAQKVGQITQAEIASISPEEVHQHHIGSVLNGGGGWPGKTPTHTLQDWLNLADAFWEASTTSTAGIPLLWGTDAVHGHNNVRGVTLFPHNIGLGASGNPELVKEIATVTAQQVIAAGQDWTFAPALPIANNPAWGRTYESYSQDPNAVYRYAKAAVEGYQSPVLANGVLATAKHFIGDGSTNNGRDQGDNFLFESQMRNREAQGYYGAMEADVQVVMSSFNSWWTKRLHGHEYLLTDVLKKQMGFDGFIISDWDGIEDVYKCSAVQCPQAINAGIDMVMVSSRWAEFVENTIADVEAGRITMARLDDAVRRILRVKIRAGLFEKPKPSERNGAGDQTIMNSAATNELARRAVQQTAVLLKNDDQTLPLSTDGNYLVLGRADHIGVQSGGWSLNWQGGAFDNSFFGESATLLDGVEGIVSTHEGRVFTSLAQINTQTKLNAAIVMINERSYAEGAGDMLSWQSTRADRQLGFSGLEQIQLVAERFPELPLVIVYIGGRPLWLNPQINQSDAFVVGWLPGTQGAGIADLLFGRVDFTAKLPLNWAKDDCEGDTIHMRRAAFPIGYGLALSDMTIVEKLPERASIDFGTNGLTWNCVWQRSFMTPWR